MLAPLVDQVCQEARQMSGSFERCVHCMPRRLPIPSTFEETRLGEMEQYAIRGRAFLQAGLQSPKRFDLRSRTALLAEEERTPKLRA